MRSCVSLFTRGYCLARVPCIVLLAACSLTFAQQEAPTYQVSRAGSPIVIDGEKDAAWANASEIEFVFPWADQPGLKQRTTARLLWDDNNLYVLYECEDEDIVALYTRRDDPTYRDDAVEIFINPRPSQETTYYGLEMNAGAVLYDYVAVMPRTFYRRFQLEGVRLAVKLNGTLNVRGDKDRGWTLELAIPWQNFDTMAGRPTPGERWRAQLSRWDGVEPARRLSMWTDPQAERPWPHVPERFGWLEFVDEPSARR